MDSNKINIFKGYIYYSNRRHPQKITPAREEVITLQKPVQSLKKNSK